MQPDAFLSPLVLTVSAITAVFLIILTTIDAKRSRHRKFLRKLMTSYVIRKSAKRFSVIVELDRSADTIWPLLEHLSELGYEKLRVVVLVRHTAGKRSLTELRRYQRSNRARLRLSVIKHRKGLDRDMLLRRHVDGELVMWLDRNDRLEAKFLGRVSLEFLDPSLDAIMPRIISRLDDTLAGAATAWREVSQDLWSSLMNAKTETVVYRRTTLLRNDIAHVRRVNDAVLMRPRFRMGGLTEWAWPLGLTVTIGIICAVASIALPVSWPYVALAAIGGTVLTLGLIMASFPYSFMNKLTLLLFLPFWPIIALAHAGGRMISRLALRRRLRTQTR